MESCQSKAADFVIIGSGIMGLALARSLYQKHPDAKIIILEKEPTVGLHASGKNSGVLHSGIYYPEHSLKALVCREGAEELYQYCLEHKLPINRIGKIILPTSENDLSQLALLFERAEKNKIPVEKLDAHRLKELEPMANPIVGQALFVASTSVIDPLTVLVHLQHWLTSKGVSIQFDSEVIKIDPVSKSVICQNQKYHYGHLFNAAGLHADKIASACGVAQRYAILPFKGIYYRLDQRADITLRHLLYPVPNLDVPFLGVHFTKKITGDMMVGPSAIPVLGRENYHLFQGINLQESFQIFFRLAQQYWLNKKGFRKFAHQEASHYLKSEFVQAAKRLVPSLESSFLQKSHQVGIRAQLLDLKKQELIMDFLVEQTPNATHILNAVSPAFTSSMSFAKWVIKQSLS